MTQPLTDPALIRAMSDGGLCAAYQQTSGEPADGEAATLLVYIERRGLDSSPEEGTEDKIADRLGVLA